MKKIISLLVAIIVLSAVSLCAFAAESPKPEEKDNKYTVIGIIMKNGKVLPGAQVDFKGVGSGTTNQYGKIKFENVVPGDHELSVVVDSSNTSSVAFNIIEGNNTGFTSLADGKFNITVAKNVRVIAVTFDISSNKIYITKVLTAESDSDKSPESGSFGIDMLGYVLMLTAVTGVFVSVYFKKRYCK